MTYSAPMFVTAEFINNCDGRDQEPDRVHGGLPADDPQGHVHHQRHRARGCLAAGPLARRLLRPPGGQDLRQGHLQLQGDPLARGAWLEFEIDKRDSVGRADRPQAQAERHRAAQGARLGRGSGSWSGSASSSRCWPPWRRTTPPARTTRCSTSTASCARASRRPGSPPRRCWRTCTSTAKRYDLAKVGRYKINKKLGLSLPIRQGTLTEDDIVATIEYLVRLHAGEEEMKCRRGDHPGRDRRHRPLRQPQAAHRRRADPEPGPAGPGPDGARGQGADDHPGRRGDHAADADQHPAGGGLHQGVLRHQPALPVHGPDQPAGRADPQAAAVRARPRRPVP